MMAMKLVIVICFLSFALAYGASPEDEITNLPGLNPPPTFKQYSGYLQVSDTRYFHYWFVESQSNPTKDPIVLWLNGGPGCSSLIGFLQEHGPFLATPDGGLSYNPYAWNKIANVLYLESPAGVGYSYATDRNITTDDNLAALHNLLALQLFFDKFPEYLSNNFYISGESYGGIYVPTLTALVLKTPFGKNLKGILVGNGLSSYSINDNSLLYFAHYHGLFDEKLWDSLLQSCCPGNNATDVCMFSLNKKPECQSNIAKATDVINYGLDVYNLYAQCYGGVKGKSHYLDGAGLLFKDNKYVQRKRALRGQYRHANGLKDTLPCSNDTAITTYLNSKDVRKALFIPDHLPSWSVCSEDVSSHYVMTYPDMVSTYQQIFAAKRLRVLIYNGDVDMACNFLGDEWFFDAFKFNVIANRRPWLFTDEDNTQQVGGYVKVYENNLTYTTIRGSGHMVPQDKPLAAYYFFQKFLNNLPL